MSPKFLREFKKEHQCGACPKGGAKTPGKSLCDRHLTVARLLWRVTAFARRCAGYCMDCNRPAVTGGRCNRHRAVNLRKCHTYMAMHGTERRQAYRDEIARYRAIGLCGQCPEHPSLAPGRITCDACRGQGFVRRRPAGTTKAEWSRRRGLAAIEELRVLGHDPTERIATIAALSGSRAVAAIVA